MGLVMLKPFLVLLLVISITQISSENILVLSFLSSRSHKLTYLPLVKELGVRGHQVTLVSPVKSSAKEGMKNVEEIMTLDTEGEDASNPCRQFDPFTLKEEGRVGTSPWKLVERYGDVCRRSYDLPQIKGLLKREFDLVLFQPLFNDCALGLVYKLKAPLILFFPTGVPHFIVHKLGGYFPPSFVPNILTGYSQEELSSSFFKRFINFGYNFGIDLFLNFYYEPSMSEIYREKLGDDEIPGVNEILKNASMVFSNGHFAYGGVRPYLPDTVDVGGLHSREAKPLPRTLDSFVSLNGSSKGFILFSLGSGIKADRMPESKRLLLANVFSRVRQQVLWKWNTDKMLDGPRLSKNVKVAKWLPQQDLLGHEGIKLFITHCGLGSIEEAVYHQVPLIGLPLYGDQAANCKQARNIGFLKELDWNKLTEETLLEAIKEVLSNPGYKENVTRLSKVFKDQGQHPLDRAVYWTEYVMRHKGAAHLRSPSRNLNFFEYHSIDVILAYLFIVSTALLILYLIAVKLILKPLCSLFFFAFSKNGKEKMKNQ